MKKKGKFGPKMLTSLFNKESFKITDVNMQYMRAVWRRWDVECCIVNPQSGFASEEERFESADKNVALLLHHAKARGICRTCLLSITQGLPIRWGVSLEGRWLL